MQRKVAPAAPQAQDTNPLRGSHQAASMHTAKPLVPRAGRTSCARSRRNKYRQHRHEHQRHSGASASRISNEPIRKSFSGISTGRNRNPEGPMSGEPVLYDRPMSCRIGQHIWTGCLKVTTRLTLEGVIRSPYRPFYMRIPPRYTATEAERCWRKQRQKERQNRA